MKLMSCIGVGLLFSLFCNEVFAQVTTTQITMNETFEQDLKGWNPIGNAKMGVMPIQTSPSLPLWSYSGGKYVTLSKNATIYQWVSIPKGTQGLSIPITGGRTLGHTEAFSGFGVNYYDVNGNYISNDWHSFDVIRGYNRVPTNSHTSYSSVPRNAGAASVWCSTQDNGIDYSEVWLDSLGLNAIKNTDPTNLLIDMINGNGVLFSKQEAYDASFHSVPPPSGIELPFNNNINLNAGYSSTPRNAMSVASYAPYRYVSITQLVPLDGTKKYCLQYGVLGFQGKGSIGVDYCRADGTKIS